MLYPTDGDMPLCRGDTSVLPDEDKRYDAAVNEYRKALAAKNKAGCEAARFKLSQLGREAGFVRP